VLAADHPTESDAGEVAGDPPETREDVLAHLETAVDILEVLVGTPGGALHDDPLETALDHLYLAASALRHRRPSG
jgi:hypothetical protein